jgi:hypothetical protein
MPIWTKSDFDLEVMSAWICHCPARTLFLSSIAAHFVSSNGSSEKKMPNVVKVGTKLTKKDAPGYLLEVIELWTPNNEHPHARARVSITSYDLGVRLYSISALEDPKLFRPLAEAKSDTDLR